MKAKEIMQALIDGKKVGTDSYDYVYLNVYGDLMRCTDAKLLQLPEFLLSKMIYYSSGKVISEDGP